MEEHGSDKKKAIMARIREKQNHFLSTETASLMILKVGLDEVVTEPQVKKILPTDLPTIQSLKPAQSFETLINAFIL